MAPIPLERLATRWDVYRRTDGTAVTIPQEKCWSAPQDEDGFRSTFTEEEQAAILHAWRVWCQVQGDGTDPGPDARRTFWNTKSRLLGRMLYQGLPPHDRPPPKLAAGGWWEIVEDGITFMSADDGRGGKFPHVGISRARPDVPARFYFFGADGGWTVDGYEPRGNGSVVADGVLPVTGIRHPDADGVWQVRRATADEAAGQAWWAPTPDPAGGDDDLPAFATVTVGWSDDLTVRHSSGVGWTRAETLICLERVTEEDEPDVHG